MSMMNGLIDETSPYLLQHAKQPVDWMPWGEEAFLRARREDKMVFLSVGYSTCHWCHVMAHESFDDERIASVLNAHFVAVKVDREERPDIDAVYMEFVQATTGQGGWPMSVWLTPEGRPVVGGTYFPPEDRYGRAGFPRICLELARLWREERERMVESAARLGAQLAEARSAPAIGGFADEPVFRRYIADCRRRFDADFGGFGSAPKFPRPSVLRALMQLSERYGRGTADGSDAWDMAERTLRAMAMGGMHDQLGGGFHRYSVDRRWHVPHYEKMLYDQAQLVVAYLEAWQGSGDGYFREVAERTLGYLSGTMRDACGAFHAAEDADSLPEAGAAESREGAFWTWRAAEIRDCLPPEDAALFAAAYGVEDEGNAAPESDPHGELAGCNTLYRAVEEAGLAERFGVTADEVEARLRAAVTILLERRSRRPMPHRDDKIVTAWNGLAVWALAMGGRVMARPDLTDLAVLAAAFLRGSLWDGRVLYRSFRGQRGSVQGFAADYVNLIAGLLELDGADPGGGWLGWAVQLQERLDADHWDGDRSGYVMRPVLAGGVLTVIREDHDGAEPCPNHLAVENLLKLAVLSGSGDYAERAEILLRAGADLLEGQPFAVPVLVAAADLHGRGVVKYQVPVGADPGVVARLRREYHPRAVFARGEGSEVLVCEGQSCRFV